MDVLTYIILHKCSIGKINNRSPNSDLQCYLDDVATCPTKTTDFNENGCTRWLNLTSIIKQISYFLLYVNGNKYCVYHTIRYFIKPSFWAFHSFALQLITVLFGNDGWNYDNLQMATSILMFPPITSRKTTDSCI